MFLVLTDHINLFMKPNTLKMDKKGSWQTNRRAEKHNEDMEIEVHRSNKTTQILPKLKF